MLNSAFSTLFNSKKVGADPISEQENFDGVDPTSTTAKNEQDVSPVNSSGLFRNFLPFYKVTKVADDKPINNPSPVETTAEQIEVSSSKKQLEESIQSYKELSIFYNKLFDEYKLQDGNLKQKQLEFNDLECKYKELIRLHEEYQLAKLEEFNSKDQLYLMLQSEFQSLLSNYQTSQFYLNQLQEQNVYLSNEQYQMKFTIESRNTYVAELESQINDLKVTINDLNDQIKSSRDLVITKDRELDTLNDENKQKQG